MLHSRVLAFLVTGIGISCRPFLRLSPPMQDSLEMPPSSTLTASWGAPACNTVSTPRPKIYNSGRFRMPLRAAPSAGRAGCRRRVESHQQQGGRPFTSVCSASPGEDSSEDGWSLRPFWGVVSNRETERSLCCTDPRFIEKKERLKLPGAPLVSCAARSFPSSEKDPSPPHADECSALATTDVNWARYNQQASPCAQICHAMTTAIAPSQSCCQCTMEEHLSSVIATR